MKRLSCIRPLDRVKFGRVSRTVFWSTAAADVLLIASAFFGPLEVAYQLQLEPEGWFMRTWIFSWGFLVVTLSVCLLRLARRRLHDAGFSGHALWWLMVPFVGWTRLGWLLIKPSVLGMTLYDKLQ